MGQLFHTLSQERQRLDVGVFGTSAKGVQRQMRMRVPRIVCRLTSAETTCRRRMR